MAMTAPQVLARLEDLGTEKVRAQVRKRGAGDAQFGVKLGDVREVAKGVKRDHALALEHPEMEALREAWMTGPDPWAARFGWSLTAERVGKRPEGLDLIALLDRIERELADAAPEPQWTMNNTLAGIGIHHPEHRERALAIGEALRVYRDYPTPRGCTSPFAPLWIGEMVRRQ